MQHVKYISNEFTMAIKYPTITKTRQSFNAHEWKELFEKLLHILHNQKHLLLSCAKILWRLLTHFNMFYKWFDFLRELLWERKEHLWVVVHICVCVCMFVCMFGCVLMFNIVKVFCFYSAKISNSDNWIYILSISVRVESKTLL